MFCIVYNSERKQGRNTADLASCRLTNSFLLTDRQTERATERETDRQTDLVAYRVAASRLKTAEIFRLPLPVPLTA